MQAITLPLSHRLSPAFDLKLDFVPDRRAQLLTLVTKVRESPGDHNTPQESFPLTHTFHLSAEQRGLGCPGLLGSGRVTAYACPRPTTPSASTTCLGHTRGSPGRRPPHPSSSARRLAKSTLLLIPLFGVHYMVFAAFPIGISSTYQILFELCVGSFQVGEGSSHAGRATPQLALTPLLLVGPGRGGSLLLPEQ
jgi:hypothetical protein